MKRILFLLCALLGLGASGAWATEYTMFNQGVGTFYDYYGTRASNKMSWTSGSNSGMAGFQISLTGSNVTLDKSSNWALVVHSSTDETPYKMTLQAPDGYQITGYELTAQIWSSSNPNSYVLTATDETTVTINSTTLQTLAVSGLSDTSTDISIVAAAASNTTQRWLTMKSLIVTMEPTFVPVNVTYALYESDGTTFVSNTIVIQEKNSAVSIPSAISSNTYFDYATEGTISEEDCTIKVTRTPKSGIVYPISNLSNSKAYKIEVPRGTYTVNDGKLANTVKSAYDINYFALINYEENYYMWSIEAGKFAAGSGNTLTDTPTAISFNASTAPSFQIKSGSNTLNATSGFATGGGFDSWSAADDGNRCVIYEMEDFDPTDAIAALDDYFHPNYTVTYIVKDGSDNVLFTSEPEGTTLGANITILPAEYQLTNFYTYNTVDVTISATGNTDVEFIAAPKEDALVKYTADTSNPYYYNLNIRSKYLVYNSEATGEVTLQNTSEPFNANASWAFVGEPYAGFKVINKTKGSDYCLTYTSVITARHSDNNVQFVAATECTDKYWVIDTNKSGLVLRMKENPSIYFHHDNSNNYLRTCSVSEWSAVHDDDGSTIEAVSDDDVLFALYDSMKDYIYGDGLGKYTATGITADQAQNTISQAGEVITDENTANYAEAYKALNDLKSITAINQPSAGFYRIKGVANNTYLSGNASVVEGKTDRLSFTTTTDASNIFYFDGAKLYDFAKGRAANGRDVGIVGATGMNYEFETSSSEAGKYAICFTPDDGKKRWLYAHSSGYADQNGAEDQYCRYDLEEVNTLPVTISATGYATLYAPVALTIPEGVTASTLTIGYKDHLNETNVEVTIPANTPVMLSGDNGNPATSGTYNFTIAEDVLAINQANELIGTIAAIAAPDESYILQNHDGVVGFYQVDTSVATPNVPGFRAYIPASDSSVKAFFFGDTATGINAIKDASVDGEIYDLSGRRVSKMQRGVYVVGGKKVAVK